MDSKTLTLAVHGGCVLVIVLCFLVGETALAHEPVLARVVEGLGVWLYGKLGFKPAAPVLERIMQKLDPERVELIMSQRPPAAGSAAPPKRTVAPPPSSEVKS